MREISVLYRERQLEREYEKEDGGREVEKEYGGSGKI